MRPAFSDEPGWEVWNEQAAEYFEEMRGDVGVSTRADDVGLPLCSALDYVGFEAHRGLSRQNVYLGLQRLLELRTAVWRTSALGETVPIVNLGETIQLGPTTPAHVRSPSQWPGHWGVAWAGRHQPLIDTLLEVGATWVADAPGIAHSDCSRQIILAYEDFEKREPGWTTHIDEALAVMEPLMAVPAERPYYVRSYRILRLMRAFDRMDAAEINERLYESVLQHHEEHKPDEEYGFIPEEHTIAWPQLGLACKAHDAGIPIEVESEWIPGWIVRAEWPS